jgi:hypothetical protein
MASMRPPLEASQELDLIPLDSKKYQNDIKTACVTTAPGTQTQGRVTLHKCGVRQNNRPKVDIINANI